MEPTHTVNKTPVQTSHSLQSTELQHSADSLGAHPLKDQLEDHVSVLLHKVITLAKQGVEIIVNWRLITNKLCHRIIVTVVAKFGASKKLHRHTRC